MQVVETEGIVLKSIPFKEGDKIVTLFTAKEGLIKLYVKGPRQAMSALTFPFVRAEYLCVRGRGEFFRLREGKLLSSNLFLRDSLEHLLAAEEMTLFLLRSMGERESEELFSLFVSYFEGMKEVSALTPHLLSFFLKVYKMEGMWQLQNRCLHCHLPLESSMRYRGERFCKKDAVKEALFFPEAEEQCIEVLLEKSIKHIQKMSFDEKFLIKLKTLLEQMW